MSEHHPVEKVDLRVTEAVADARHAPAVRAAGWLSEAADQPPLRIAMAAWLAVGVARRDPRLLRAGVRMLAAHTLATWAKSAIKARIDRTRPDHALATRYRMEKGGTERHELSSFPSGHTAGALAVTQALARDYPETRATGLAASTAVAVVQVPRCKHFVSDVAAGAAIGWAAEQVSSRAIDWVAPALDRVVRRRPASGAWTSPAPSRPSEERRSLPTTERSVPSTWRRAEADDPVLPTPPVPATSAPPSTARSPVLARRLRPQL